MAQDPFCSVVTNAYSFLTCWQKAQMPANAARQKKKIANLIYPYVPFAIYHPPSQGWRYIPRITIIKFSNHRDRRPAAVYNCGSFWYYSSLNPHSLRWTYFNRYLSYSKFVSISHAIGGAHYQLSRRIDWSRTNLSRHWNVLKYTPRRLSDL